MEHSSPAALNFTCCAFFQSANKCPHSLPSTPAINGLTELFTHLICVSIDPFEIHEVVRYLRAPCSARNIQVYFELTTPQTTTVQLRESIEESLRPNLMTRQSIGSPRCWTRRITTWHARNDFSHGICPRKLSAFGVNRRVVNDFWKTKKKKKKNQLQKDDYIISVGIGLRNELLCFQC